MTREELSEKIRNAITRRVPDPQIRENIAEDIVRELTTPGTTDEFDANSLLLADGAEHRFAEDLAATADRIDRSRGLTLFGHPPRRRL